MMKKDNHKYKQISKTAVQAHLKYTPIHLRLYLTIKTLNMLTHKTTISNLNLMYNH